MKKSPNYTLKHKKLVLRREAIILLVPPQLSHAMGGDGAVSTLNCITHSTEPNCGI